MMTAGMSTGSLKTVQTCRPSQAARPVSAVRRTISCSAEKNLAQTLAVKATDAVKFAAAFTASALVAGAASAITYDQLQGLTYLQVKGSGVANTCPVIEGGSSDLKNIKPGNYKLVNFCMEPTSFTVKEEAQFKGQSDDFVKTKLMTRLTYTLAEITGSLKVGAGGEVEFKEEDGIDYAAVTVQLPGGERVPFLFSIKDLAAKGTLDGFGGEFNVPSYRGSSFLDPKGRGASSGYDTAVGIVAGGDLEELEKENLKTTDVLKGQAVFSVAKVDPKTGEIAGVFESIQPSDTDLGAHAPKDVKIQGLWYGQLS